jgi:hypothetical protein
MMAVLAVCSEPFSDRNSLLIRENTGNFADSRPDLPKSGSISDEDSTGYLGVPDESEQGIFSA